jgi:hypothetical protein
MGKNIYAVSPWKTRQFENFKSRPRGEPSAGVLPLPWVGTSRHKPAINEAMIAGPVNNRDSNGKIKLDRGGSGQLHAKIHQYFDLTNSNRFYVCFGGGSRKSYSDSDRVNKFPWSTLN